MSSILLCNRCKVDVVAQGAGEDVLHGKLRMIKFPTTIVALADTLNEEHVRPTTSGRPLVQGFVLVAPKPLSNHRKYPKSVVYRIQQARVVAHHHVFLVIEMETRVGGRRWHSIERSARKQK